MTWDEVVQRQHEVARRLGELAPTSEGDPEWLRLVDDMNEATLMLTKFGREHEVDDAEFGAAYKLHRDALIAYGKRHRVAERDRTIAVRRADHVAFCARAVTL